MSLKIKTSNETEHRYLTITESENLYFLFLFRGEYKSYFPFAYNDQSGDGKFVGYAGSVCSLDTDDESFDDSFPKDVDLYICPNGMKTKHKRTSDNLINIQNLVIDIDSHNSNMSAQDLNTHIDSFVNKAIDKMCIKPNFINKTGRGVHLWFCIEPCHVSLNKICLNTIDMLCNHISDIMNEFNETTLTIDRTSSLRLNGLFRVPYSYNTKANTWSVGELIHTNTPNINNLYRKLKSKGLVGKYFSDNIKRKKRKTYQPKFMNDIKNNDYTPCLIHRKKFMDHLFETRDIDVGSRDIMLFGMYSTVYRLFEIEDARQYCSDLNDKLNNPLPYGELLMIFYEVEKKKHKFTVERFFDFISATESEIEWFNKSTKKEEQKQQKRNEKEDRNNKVIELYSQGIKKSEIARITGISRWTVDRILK